MHKLNSIREWSGEAAEFSSLNDGVRKFRTSYKQDEEPAAGLGALHTTVLA